jgi:hypothetical protein
MGVKNTAERSDTIIRHSSIAIRPFWATRKAFQNDEQQKPS